MNGILFKPDMINAIVEGRKTQTRRLDGLGEINQESNGWEIANWQYPMTPKFAKGAVLFVRYPDEGHDLQYRAVRPRYKVGEVVYIEETYMVDRQYDHLRPSEIPKIGRKVAIWYYADGNHYADKVGEGAGKVRSPLFMPAWVARYFIQITDVKLERLQEITDEDAIKEGISVVGRPELNDLSKGKFRHAYANLWDSENPKHPWASNDWVWVYTFKLVPIELEKI